MKCKDAFFSLLVQLNETSEICVQSVVVSLPTKELVLWLSKSFNTALKIAIQRQLGATDIVFLQWSKQNSKQPFETARTVFQNLLQSKNNSFVFIPFAAEIPYWRIKYFWKVVLKDDWLSADCALQMWSERVRWNLLILRWIITILLQTWCGKRMLNK